MEKKEIERIEDIICPYCGFEIGTDDCTCGGLIHVLPGNETRMDYLVKDISARDKRKV